LAKRLEKSGFWVTVTAVIFYPIAAIGKVVTRNAERIQRSDGMLLVMNHISHLDPAVDAVFVHKNGRVPRFLAKESLFRVPLFKYLIRGAGSIPVYRRSAGAADSLEAANASLSEGKLVVIYPEGTITTDPDGWPMRAHTGAARLALANDVAVIPIARWGTREIFNGYTRKFRPFPRKRITINVGAPIDLSTYRDKPLTNELLRQVTDLMMTEVQKLLAEVREEPAPAEFYNPARKKKDEESAS